MVGKKKYKVLITGASGFIGSHLINTLINKGYFVRGIYRNNKISDRIKINTKESFEEVKADLSNIADLTQIVKDCDIVIHSAGLASDWGSFDIFKENNYTATVNLLNITKKEGCGTFIYISSAAVHGFGEHLDSTETGPYYKLKYSYSRTKKMAEDYSLKENSSNFKVVVIRPGNVYGPGDYTSTYAMFRQIKKGSMGYIGGGRAYTCPVYIDDICEGIAATLTADNISGEVINITDGQRVTWKEYVDRMYEVSGSSKHPINLPVWSAYLAAFFLTGFYKIFQFKRAPALTLYRVDQASNNYHFNNMKAIKKLGFSPTVFYWEGLKRTVDAFKEDEYLKKN